MDVSSVISEDTKAAKTAIEEAMIVAATKAKKK